MINFAWYYSEAAVHGIPEKQDLRPWEDPGPYKDSELFDDPRKTQDLILKFLGFHIMCLIWWDLQLKADLFIIAEGRCT